MSRLTGKVRYYRLKKAGLCTKCGNPRGIDGTSVYCRKCADKTNQGNGRRREGPEYKKRLVQPPLERYQRKLLQQAKQRARKNNLFFDILYEDIEWNAICPVLGIPLMRNIGEANDNSPSLDRLIPKKGYVKGNIRVISIKANRIKNNATIEEIRKVADWLEQELDDQ